MRRTGPNLTSFSAGAIPFLCPSRRLHGAPANPAKTAGCCATLHRTLDAARPRTERWMLRDPAQNAGCCATLHRTLDAARPCRDRGSLRSIGMTRFYMVYAIGNSLSNQRITHDLCTRVLSTHVLCKAAAPFHGLDLQLVINAQGMRPTAAQCTDLNGNQMTNEQDIQALLTAILK